MSRKSNRRKHPQTFQNQPSLSAQMARTDTTHPASSPFDHFLHQCITVLFHFLVITVPFFFTWFNEELFEFNKIILTYALTALIGGCWLMRMIINKKVLVKRTWFDVPIGLFLLSQILSTIFSIHPYTSWFGYYTRFHGGLLSTITYLVLFYSFVSNIQKKQLVGLLASIILAAFGAALYAIPEHFGTSPSCILIDGRATTDCWSESTNPRFRIFGTFGQPNWLAAYAVVLLPLAVSLMIISLSESQKRTPRVLTSLSFITSIALFMSLLFTKSRSGLIGAGLAGGLYGIGMFWYLTVNKDSFFKDSTYVKYFSGLVGGLAITLVLLIGLFGTPFTPTLSSLVSKYSSDLAAPLVVEPTATPTVANRLDVGGTDSGEIRKIVWEGALKVWQRYPLLGSGVETFAYSYYLDRPVEHNNVSEWDFLYNKAHNEFLNFLATTGLVGLVSYCILIGSFMVMPLIKSLTSKVDKPSLFWLSLATATGIAGLSVSNFFGFSTVMVSLLMFLLPAAVFVMADETPPTSQATKTSDLSFIQLLLLSGTGLGMVWLVFMVNTWWRADNLYVTGKQYVQAGKLGEGAMLLKQAAELSPQEALFHDELALTYSQIAVALTQQGNATQAAPLKQATEIASDTALALNPVHLNFYKSRARAFITLANVDESYLAKAQDSLESAQKLAPTDAKVVYNIALLQLSQSQTTAGVSNLEKAILMKPNYEGARMSLAGQYVAQGKLNEAAEQYQFILASIEPGNTIAATELAAVQASLSAKR